MSIFEKILIVCLTILFLFIFVTQTQPNFRPDGNARYSKPEISQEAVSETK